MGDWPLPARSATGDSYAPDGPVFEDAPSVEWTFAPTVPEDVDAHPDDATFGQPVVAGDRLYVVRRIVFGTDVEDPGGHALQARDAGTGQLRWSYELPTEPTVPAVRGDAVLVASENTLHAVDARDGSRRWGREFPSDVDEVVPTTERVYVDVVPGEGSDYTVHALASDYSTQWFHGFGDDDVRALAVGPDHVYVGLWSGGVRAFERPDGEPAWSGSALPGGGVSGGSAFVGSMVATDCAAFATTGDHLTAFDADGRRRWLVEGNYETALATDGRTLYGASHSDREDDWRRSLHALDAASGQIRWEQPFDAGGGGVLTDGALYQPLTDGLIAVAPDDGTELWRTTTDLGSLALGGDALYGTVGRDLTRMR